MRASLFRDRTMIRRPKNQHHSKRVPLNLRLSRKRHECVLSFWRFLHAAFPDQCLLNHHALNGQRKNRLTQNRPSRVWRLQRRSLAKLDPHSRDLQFHFFFCHNLHLNVLWSRHLLQRSPLDSLPNLLRNNNVDVPDRFPLHNHHQHKARRLHSIIHFHFLTVRFRNLDSLGSHALLCFLQRYG